MRLVIDLDGVLCTDTKGNYLEAKPLPEEIFIVNDAFEKGHTVVIHTGRHWDHLKLTYSQLFLWGVKYHSLVMGKPPSDILADDKAINLKDLKL